MFLPSVSTFIYSPILGICYQLHVFTHLSTTGNIQCCVSEREACVIDFCLIHFNTVPFCVSWKTTSECWGDKLCILSCVLWIWKRDGTWMKFQDAQYWEIIYSHNSTVKHSSQCSLDLRAHPPEKLWGKYMELHHVGVKGEYDCVVEREWKITLVSSDVEPGTGASERKTSTVQAFAWMYEMPA